MENKKYFIRYKITASYYITESEEGKHGTLSGEAKKSIDYTSWSIESFCKESLSEDVHKFLDDATHVFIERNKLQTYNYKCETDLLALNKV